MEYMDENKLLSVKEAAHFLGVTQIYLRKLLNEGKISYINVASGTMRKAIRIQKSAIEEFVKSREVASE